MEKGASVTLQLKRGENQFFSTLRLLNGDSDSDTKGGDAKSK